MRIKRLCSSTPMKLLIYGVACLLILLSLNACSVLNPIISHIQVKHDIRPKALLDLKEGNLLSVRDRYEKRGIPNLGTGELAVLCEIYIKHMSIENGLDCLDALQTRTTEGASERIAGKRALIAFMLGQYERSAALTRDAREAGGQYVYALAQTRLGNSRVALKTAKRWARAYDPEHVFLAANLFLASGRYHDALQVLLDPEPGLARHYSLTGARNVFGQQVETAPLKIDLFDEFGFGLLDTYSYAPAANVYVEFIIAKCELELGNRDEARKRFDRILSYPNVGAYREVHWRALSERAGIAEKDGNSMKAADFYKQAINIIESVRSSISTEAGRIGFVGNKQGVYAKFIRFLLVQDDTRTAFEYTERARSRALVDLLASQRQFGGRAGSRVEVDDMLRDYQRAESRVLETQGTGTATDIARRSSTLLAEKRQVLGGAPWLASLTVANSDVDSKDIQSQLLTKETLLSYYRDSSDWNVMVIPNVGPIINARLSLPNLDQEIRAFRTALENGSTNGYRAIARRLYDRLIKPVEEKIAMSGTLTIVPFGELHYLPFAALDSGRGLLVEEHILRVIPSAELITILKPTERPRGRLLAFGNPNRNDIPSLPYAESEAKRVTEIYKPSKLLLRGEASRLKFETLGPEYDILHFAVHGEFDRRDALRSRLLLAPSNGDTGDLEVTDLYVMEPPLRASIAVLSACETGLTEIVGGDELIGLQRGFLYAGADSIIGTLWRIADETTVYLMEEFYISLDGGSSRAEALQEAQLKTMKRYPNRGDWAAFIYTGGVG